MLPLRSMFVKAVLSDRHLDKERRESMQRCEKVLIFNKVSSKNKLLQ